jgi:hypothetical protein
VRELHYLRIPVMPVLDEERWRKGENGYFDLLSHSFKLRLPLLFYTEKNVQRFPLENSFKGNLRKLPIK